MIKSESIYRENGWTILFSFDKEGNIRKRYWIVKPRNGKEQYKKYGYKAKYPGDRGRHLVVGKERMTRKEISNRYYVTHKKEQYRRVKKYRSENPEMMLKSQHKRRNLGFVPLNKKFSDSHAHHIDKTYVIYIPERLHRTTSHNVWTGVGMDNINMKAFGFALWKQLLSEYNG